MGPTNRLTIKEMMMPYVTDMNSKELRAHMTVLQGMNGWGEPLADRLFEEITRLDEELRVATAVLREADSYLDTNSFTNIGHGSVLHTRFKDVLADQACKTSAD